METINISKHEAIWILLCKGWVFKKYPIKNDMTFMNYIRPYFEEVYGWSADDYENDFLRCVFTVLFDIFMKIRINENNNSDLKRIISKIVFETNNNEKVSTRSILAIRSEISMTQVIMNNIKRFDLDQATDLFEY
jgi:hypothetical protein